jgi:hypothetical protein
MLTQERLRQKLRYDPDTGEFHWLTPRVGVRSATGLAGSIDEDGYVRIKLDSRSERAHRLAFLYMTGKPPKGSVDHINGTKSDNRWSNLRDVPHEVNAQNLRGPKSTSTTGLLGVRQYGSRFQAQISINARMRHIGYFATAEEAHAAYLEAKRKHHKGNTL